MSIQLLDAFKCPALVHKGYKCVSFGLSGLHIFGQISAGNHTYPTNQISDILVRSIGRQIANSNGETILH